MQKLFKHVVSQDTSGRERDEHVPLRQGRRAASPTRARRSTRALKGQDIQYVIPRQTMLIELPIAVLKNELEQGHGEQVHPVREGARRAGSVRASTASARSTRRSPTKYATKFPTRPGHLQDRRQDHRRLAQRRQGLVRPEQGPDGQDRAGGRRADLWLAPRTPSPRRGERRASEREGRNGPLARLRHDLPVGDRRAPDRGARLGVARATACTQLLGRRSRARRRSPR